jgi:YHYH protein
VIKRRIVIVLACGIVAACATAGAGMHGVAPDVTHLPIGGTPIGHAQEGKVYACQTNLNGGGAQATGAWINGDGTFDLTKKPIVDGDVHWPNASLDVASKGKYRVITGDGLPLDSTTGTFPVSPSDDAYAFDRNPNTIRAQTLSLRVPKNPVEAAQPSCLSLGMIGMLLTGVPLFDALDAAGRDALAYEIQDHCGGHPERTGSYHYHALSSCVTDTDKGSGHSKLLGYARDGFGIYGPRGEHGEILSSADLDECHGHTHTITWDGKKRKMYHYHATADYPYTVGCYRGAPAA